MFLKVYSGSDTQCRVNGLDSKTEYSIRVAGVRVPAPGIQLTGTYSPPGIFTTSHGVGGASNVYETSLKSGTVATKPGTVPQVNKSPTQKLPSLKLNRINFVLCRKETRIGPRSSGQQ